MIEKDWNWLKKIEKNYRRIIEKVKKWKFTIIVALWTLIPNNIYNITSYYNHNRINKIIPHWYLTHNSEES